MSKRRKYQEPVEPPIAIGAQGPPISGRVIDPHLPLPGPVRQVNSQRPSRKENLVGKERYDQYLRHLRAQGGDPIAALVQLTGQSEEAIYEYGVTKLHNEIVKGYGDRPMDAMLNDYDLTQAAVLGVIREHLYGDHPAASLKAAEMVREMLGDSAVGETIEDLVREALEDSA